MNDVLGLFELHSPEQGPHGVHVEFLSFGLILPDVLIEEGSGLFDPTSLKQVLDSRLIRLLVEVEESLLAIDEGPIGSSASEVVDGHFLDQGELLGVEQRVNLQQPLVEDQTIHSTDVDADDWPGYDNVVLLLRVEVHVHEDAHVLGEEEDLVGVGDFDEGVFG